MLILLYDYIDFTFPGVCYRHGSYLCQECTYDPFTFQHHHSGKTKVLCMDPSIHQFSCRCANILMACIDSFLHPYRRFNSWLLYRFFPHSKTFYQTRAGLAWKTGNVCSEKKHRVAGSSTFNHFCGNYYPIFYAYLTSIYLKPLVLIRTSNA